MRNVPYSERIRQFVNTNIQIRNNTLTNSPIGNNNAFATQYLHPSERPLTIDDLTDIWSLTVKGYLQNFGLGNIEPQIGYLDGINMYSTDGMPVFGVIPPVSYRTAEELANGNPPQHVFSVDHEVFNSKQDLVDYLVGCLIQGKEIFLHSLDLSPLIYDPTHFQPIRKWVIRLKVVDWGTLLNRTDFSFLKLKKNFTPSKNIPTFKM